MQNERKNGGGRLATAATAGAGIGIGTIVGALIQGQPQILEQVVGWGPGLLIIAGFLWMAQSYAPQFIASQQRMAEGMAENAREIGSLAGAIRESLSREDDVRMAVRALSGEVRELAQQIREEQEKR